MSRYRRQTHTGHKVVTLDDNRTLILHDGDEILSLSPEVSKQFANKLAYILDEAMSHGAKWGAEQKRKAMLNVLGIKQDE